LLKLIILRLVDIRKTAVTFKVIWSFENFLLHKKINNKCEFSLPEVNNMLSEYCSRYNEQPHRRFKMNRIEAWSSGLSNNIYNIEPGEWQNIYRKEIINLDSSGCFYFLNNNFYTEELINCEVYLYENVIDGFLLIVDPKNGNRYKVNASL
jgi:hypothetical protein